MAPLGFLVHGGICEAAEGADHASVGTHDGSRDHGSGRLIHEGHEFIREARHGAADTDAADVGATADTAHPAALGDIAVDHGTPATELDQALGGTVLTGKISLLVVGATIATFVHCLAEQPCGA